MPPEKVLDICRKRKRTGESITDMIEYLYNSGFSITDSILAVSSVYGIRRGEAKQIVAAHPCWSEVTESADKMHEELIRDLQRDPAAEVRHTP